MCTQVGVLQRGGVRMVRRPDGIADRVADLRRSCLRGQGELSRSPVRLLLHCWSSWSSAHLLMLMAVRLVYIRQTSLMLSS